MPKVNLKIKKICMIVLIFICLLSIGVSANQSSWSVNLPALSGNIDLCNGIKENTGNSAWITNTSMGGSFDCVNVWIMTASGGNGNRVTDYYSVYEGGSSVSAPYSTSISKGKTLYARGENDSITYVKVSSTGIVNF